MEKLIVSSSPHIRAGLTTRRIMLDVVLALLPATVAAVVLFGWRAAVIIAACVAASVGTEYLFNLIVRKPQTVGDLSAVVTGLLLALNMPATVNMYQCVIGSVFAIAVVKCLFGGLGCNFANPAITGRVFMLIAFSEIGGGAAPIVVDTVASATPLERIKAGATDQLPSLVHMLIGTRGGAIGETCAIALLIGFAYLVIRKIIHWQIPVVFVGTVFVLSLLFSGFDFTVALYEVLGGGLLIGAIFMATDYVTCPITLGGKLLFAFGCGLITAMIRFFGAYPEGVSFSILLMNILSPYLEKWTFKKPLGGAKA
ncbi:MAG: RnfABCDGE type electron transport complex subunit D [Clostridia bacterium]|nr:RnfABCDGE type electron transport complex subunit D [Clostridia bacterium]